LRFKSKAFALPQRVLQIAKSFCFFFQKEALPAYLLAFACAPAKAAAVVSLNLCTDQLLVLLAPEQVRALEPLARDPALSFVAAQTRSLPTVRADAEAVLALHPDLVLAGRYGAQATLALLRARGVRVVQVEQPASFAGVAAEVSEVAHLLGEEARGAALVSRMWQRLAAIHKRQGTAVLWEAGGWSAGPGSFEDAVLRAAGLTNLGTGGRIGLEALLAAHPGLLVTERAANFPSMATDLAWHPALAGMARLTVSPAWLACAGPFSVAAVEALAGE
jgi:iron complex transport system substrate-binding protein